MSRSLIRALQVRKAQVAIEFVILVSILFGAMLVFTSFVRDNFAEKEEDVSYYRLRDIALSVQSEFNLAVSLEDGYSRTFFIPPTVEGMEYNMTKEGDELMFASENMEYVVHVPDFSGELAKGNNVIVKDDGVIGVNP